MRIAFNSLAICFVCLTMSVRINATAEEWANWRGPEQNGTSREKNLVETWSLDADGKGENVLWSSIIGGRSTPIVMNGKAYLNCRTEHSVTDPEEMIHAQEQVVCFDVKTGDVLWKDVFNVCQTDIPAPRVGWANMAGDEETGNVYVHSVSGIFRCYTGDGKLVWEHSLAEEYGKISGYGGRTHTPVVDEDRVIVSYLATNWGDMKGPAPTHAYYSFDKKTGELQWISSIGGAPLDTTFSCPVVAVVHGQRMLIGGNSDGGIYGIQARTGKQLWGHVMSKRGINATPLVDGDLVYTMHGEDNLDNQGFGRIECLKINTAEDGSSSVESVWRVNNIKAGYSSPILHDGVLYVVSDTGKLYGMDAKTGDIFWEYSIGTVGKGAPVWADGKIYVMEVDGNIHILKASKEKCESLSHVSLNARVGLGKDEIYASPAVSDGRVFLVTRDRTICLGKEGVKVESDPIPKLADEKPVGDKVALLQLRPYEVALMKGESAAYKLHAFDANGRLIKTEPAAIAAVGKMEGLAIDGAILKSDGVTKPQAVTISASLGEMSATARVRAFPDLPWQWDFDELKGIAVPETWVRAHIKVKPVKMKGVNEAKEGDVADGVALGSSPGKGRGGHTVYIGDPRMKGYSIQADVLMKEDKRKLPSVGVVANRYTFFMKGNQGKLSLQSWPAHLRLGADKKFRSDPDIWYTMKLVVDVKDGVANIKGKVWEREKDEPAEWSIEATDPHANEQGSPGLAVYLLAPCYFDNVIVTKE